MEGHAVDPTVPECRSLIWKNYLKPRFVLRANNKEAAIFGVLYLKPRFDAHRLQLGTAFVIEINVSHP